MASFLLGTNWKMHKSFSEALEYTGNLITLAKAYPEYQYFMILPALYLHELGKQMKDSSVLLGAQNMHWLDEGDFTGELSPAWLADCGVQIAELGHSERRQFYNENDCDLNRKMHAALQHGMRPLLCVGESAQEKMYGVTTETLRRQLKIGLFGIADEDISRVWIAYEPVWAIGASGVPADPFYVEKVHAVLHDCLVEIFGERGREIPVLYGGSVNEENCVALAERKGVDGLFIGRAAWDMEKFKMISAQLRNYFHSKRWG